MHNPSRVSFYTLGCKLNYAETSTIEREFIERGFIKVDFGSEADVVVVNTCTVTASADKKCRNIISKAVRNSPGGYIAVVGCYSQLNAGHIAEIPGVDIVLGSREKFRIFDFAGDFKKKGRPEVYACEIKAEGEFFPSYSVSGRTRSFLKIQDGCDYFCSYCTIPLARGRSRSASMENILMQVNSIAGRGAKEVVLTGVNIGDFGKAGSGNLLDLLQVLEEKTGIERYRLSSVEPDLLSDEIIGFLAASQKFAPHLHLPLQSGCDRILEKMNRKYRIPLFSDRVEQIRKKIPLAGIGADVITGFPGETDEDFSQTLEFLAGIDISFLHVFSYSDRAGTRAAQITGKVNPIEKRRRSEALHRLADEKLRNFQVRCLGGVHKVLFESYNRKGRMFGFTGNYLKVESAWDEAMVNRFADVELIGSGEDNVMKGKVLGATVS
jgi:threonylcarbamoyladenosine tRNA methylthiotransferase MtaB